MQEGGGLASPAGKMSGRGVGEKTEHTEVTEQAEARQVASLFPFVRLFPCVPYSQPAKQWQFRSLLLPHMLGADVFEEFFDLVALLL